ncbi:amidohydrolase family protein [Aestuariirhabdus litorea]|uniref:2-pyrone-4,6-dicarboxylate hydrolase n=1 Tax=Aestuariirhabdus litorea TaxID=2528527 RepID=A0A3P3VNQ9_9GAMM|nr:amidohydrolase family protein [Aestuariirhabdus litorea]RRJ83558.1 2-pyrone-4,6-dicarboxylate hydrolase [Aestuariirhabdus litorea]RWW96779.1 2-pyrone-4,6-dicarboxylate hydrolase [Endozoicomonadaceae bacterium GTF-13]
MSRSLFDAHLHIIDPAYPLIANQGYLPEPYGVDDYRQEVAPFSMAGGAVVSGSFQGFDQTYLLAALERLGSGFVGVTQLPRHTSDEELERLDRAGVRGIRFNLYRGGSEGVEQLVGMAQRVFERCGWHTELYVDSLALAPLLPALGDIPRYSIDHLGLRREGLPLLLRAVEQGARVKATGFGRVTLDVADSLRQIHQLDPSALMFGTDLPGTRAPRRFQAADIALVEESLGSKAAERVLRLNALAFYRCGGEG